MKKGDEGMTGVVKQSQRSCFSSVLNKNLQEEKLTIIYQNIIKNKISLSEILGRHLIYLEDKMVSIPKHKHV